MRTWTLGATALCALAAGHAAAQTDPAAPPLSQPAQLVPPQTGSVPWPDVTVDQAMAQPVTVPDDYESWMLERIAVMDLRLRPAPTPEDYQIAAWALTLAAEARDADAAVWRRVVEAAFNAGDRPLLERATREVVRLDPADTLAQLRLITMRLGRYQTSEARLGAYARLLGDGGRSASALDPSLRSRLALDAALLARETGDPDAFSKYLEMATTLDSSNKEAAALALAYFQAAVPDDPIGRLQLLINLLMADPMDPHVHLAISAELQSHGEFVWAGRFHNNAVAVIGADSPEAAVRLDIRGLILVWQTLGPAEVVEILQNRLATLRHEAAFAVAAKEQRGLAVRDEERPENTRLDREYELIRLMAADAAGMRDVAAWSAADLRATALAVVEFYQRPENLPTGEAGRALAEQILAMWTEVLVVRAWAGADLQELGADIDQTLASMEGRVDLSEPIAWYALRAGQPSEVVEYFEQTEGAVYRSRLGLALTYEALGRRDDAAAVYVDIARGDPASVQSAWARSRLLFVTGQDLARTEQAGEAAALAQSVPPVLERMLRNAEEFMRMQISAPITRVGPLEIVRPRLTLANRGTLPLGVGADRPISSRFLLSPELRVGGEAVIGGVQAEVFDADQRLRLAPGEQMTIDLWPDCGFTGLFAECQAASRNGVLWRALQGFRVVDRSYTSGALCLTSATPEIYREPLLAARLSPDELAVAIGQAPESELARLARAAFAVCTSVSYAQVCTPEQAAAIGSALGERYRQGDLRTRRLLLSMLPPARMVDGLAVFGDVVRSDIAGQSDPMLLMLALLTWAQSSDDPIIAACRASPDPRVSIAAAYHAARLGPDSTPTYATSGPGIATVIGPSLPSLGRLGQ